jgi:hypothetical protein
MDKVVILRTAWEYDDCFVGDCGELVITPTERSYGEVVIVKNNTTHSVYVDYKDYVPVSSLILELF